MGAIFSYLGYAPNQQSYTRHHERRSQQLHQCCGPILILSHRDAASSSVIDICTHLITLEKDLNISRAGNIRKEAVIQHLLQYSVSDTQFKEFTIQLNAQLLALKTTIDQTNKEIEAIKDKLRKAEEAISSLTTPGVPNPTSQSPGFSNNTDLPTESKAVTGDLIDLLGCSHECDSAKSMREDSTLPDESYEDETDTGVIAQRLTPDQSLEQSFDLDYEGSSYIVHFTNSGEDQNRLRRLSENANDSSTESSSSLTGLSSTATSFTSTSSGTAVPNEVHSSLLHEGFSRLKALKSEDGNLERNVAIVSTLADKLSSLGTRVAGDQPEPASEVSTEAQDAQASDGGTIIEPRWSSEEIFDSAQDRENAIRINRVSSQYGEKDLSYPDFFKHGIHYVPKICEQDIYRTVAISGLSPSVTMMSILEKVRGGLVVDAKLVDTVNITGSQTALVTFLHEYSAMAYEDHARHHPMAFSNAVAQISVIPTPTWPIPFTLQSGIEKSGHTRCCEVHKFPRNISLTAVRRELTSSPVMKSSSLECARLGTDGVLGLRFLSIRAAVRGSAMFSKAFRYRGCTVKWIPDPCAQPLETLLDQRTETSEAVKEDAPKHCHTSDAKSCAQDDFGRLTKPDWTIDAESHRGRGFQEQVSPTSDTSNDPADRSTSLHTISSEDGVSSENSISTTEPLRQETTASMTSFAQSFFSTPADDT